MAYANSAEAQQKELEELRREVSCVLVLEKAGFRLDREATAQRSARNLKFRRENEAIIVNHDGKGWWDPKGDGKGDVFKLVQHLDPSKNLGHVRRELRDLIGKSPTLEVAERTKGVSDRPRRDPAELWGRRSAPQEGTPAWRYLTEERGLPGSIVAVAGRQGALKEGPNGTAWFGHRDADGQFTGMEMRGPEYKGFSTGGGGKRLFGFRADEGTEPARRLVVTEAAIDALSFAAVDRFKKGSLYTSTGGGMSPESEANLKQVMATVAKQPDARLVIAVDNDHQGHVYAAKLAAMAQEVGLWSGRISPKTPGDDWNKALRARGEEAQGGAAPAGSLPRLSDAITTKPATQPDAVSSSWLDQARANSPAHHQAAPAPEPARAPSPATARSVTSSPGASL
ncbi:DUF3991 and TOPRIM domain-containing protein [Acetobacter oeni]|uniref:DUF3991 domain-containing protein n=1 Tax=Acetobacter oeni TaxID=304077 RepID=A0A511XNK2_9PROT|nr:DUF3991 and TOPRIM domain-containing protein [Acetobacter oeni]MBB3884397.1 hypothetical protein [Acetobacter oeni]NHO20326.1 DUF3991 domain-containing protein [Acetobacter oeni]GBR07567.1 hypothetical protein AA21952_2376 [Acetobacter oeni LMG 21952]GEN64533.1 hypothetical protein AOE01nite_27570 [Acetobacter oeni]